MVDPSDGLPQRVVYFSNEFPNDDLKELFRRLHRHAKDKRFFLLRKFLDESTMVLKNEIAKLPPHLKKIVPHFDTILNLVGVADFRRGPLGAAMESVFLTVLEIGMFIGYFFLQLCYFVFDF